jgi:glycosyltransferase involved in cell wall biosynthesis
LQRGAALGEAMPTLSVTIIAKNEERNLPRLLASVREIADEIIVTDTGSTDRTIEIAREFGARVAQFSWIDDFSAAHNYCNSLATCDWLFMLDCDGSCSQKAGAN